MDPEGQVNSTAFQQVIASLKQHDKLRDSIRLPVVGSSMMPTLKDRDILEIELNPSYKLRRGDVVVRGISELITHRIVLIDGDRIITRGDARYWIDPMPWSEDILGKVKQIDRNGLIADMRSPRWRLVNYLMGVIGWIQVKVTWIEQEEGKSRDGRTWLHRLSNWVGKKLTWVILFLLAGKWLFQKTLRLDEKC